MRYFYRLKYCVIICIFVVLIFSCKQEKPPQTLPLKSIETVEVLAKANKPIDTLEDALEARTNIPALPTLNDTAFVKLADYSKDFVYDLRYATENNFLKEQVYECPECYTRVKTAKALLAANKMFLEKGYRIKFYDCYRPNAVQYKMWELVPNPQYVANPVKGSVHNKGGAVDITLVDSLDNELNMGTDFDYFGWKAYHDNTGLPKEVLSNRKLLKSTMESHGFEAIRSEWWHYNLIAAYRYPIADFKWDCP